MSKNNIVSEFEERITELIEARPLSDIQQRNKQIEEVNEEYFQRTGQNLPSFLLTLLTDWLLLEVLNDKDVDKVTNNKNPILSHRQLRRRIKRENVVENGIMDYLNLKYVKRKDSLAKTIKKELNC